MRGKAELHDLVGDATKARSELGWTPTVDFEELVHMLVDADLDRLRSQLEPGLLRSAMPAPAASQQACADIPCSASTRTAA